MRPGKNLGKGWLAAVLCLSIGLIGPASLRAQEPAPDEKRLGPLEKSLILPGWGQLSEKRYVEGFLFMAAEAFCLYEVFVNDHAGNRNYGLYKKAETMDDAVFYRQLTEKYDTRRNRFLLAAAAVWAVNLLDIYRIVTHKKGKDGSLSFRIERGQNELLSITARCRF